MLVLAVIIAGAAARQRAAQCKLMGDDVGPLLHMHGMLMPRQHVNNVQFAVFDKSAGLKDEGNLTGDSATRAISHLAAHTGDRLRADDHGT